MRREHALLARTDDATSKLPLPPPLNFLPLLREILQVYIDYKTSMTTYQDPLRGPVGFAEAVFPSQRPPIPVATRIHFAIVDCSIVLGRQVRPVGATPGSHIP